MYNMPEKREVKKHTEEGMGVAGFTLGIIGIAALVGLMLPLVFALLYMWIALFVCFITGIVLCRKQQKIKKTKKGKIGLILNIVGLILMGILLIGSIIYVIMNLPEIIGGQNFPIA
jgi:predicted ABC-type exoprotein transport system permease subunit